MAPKVLDRPVVGGRRTVGPSQGLPESLGAVREEFKPYQNQGFCPNPRKGRHGQNRAQDRTIFDRCILASDGDLRQTQPGRKFI
jgi:hypothetical protein